MRFMVWTINYWTFCPPNLLLLLQNKWGTQTLYRFFFRNLWICRDRSLNFPRQKMMFTISLRCCQASLIIWYTQKPSQSYPTYYFLVSPSTTFSCAIASLTFYHYLLCYSPHWTTLSYCTHLVFWGLTLFSPLYLYKLCFKLLECLHPILHFIT